MTSFVGAIDQGTTSTRFMVFDQAGNVVAIAQQEHPQIFPQPGWVEHSPIDIARNTDAVIAEALRSAQLTAKDLVAIGITNQRETTMIWDRRTGQPLHNALVWQDTRVDPLVAYFSAQGGGKDRFRALTGLPLASYFSGLKLKWLLDNVPNARALADAGHLAFGTMDTWVLWNLTGGANGGLHLTDVTNASRTQLMGLNSLQWDEELLRTFSIPRSVLPKIASSSEVYGQVADGPLKGVPIAGILGDQQAALVGQTCFEPGEAKNTYGTGCFLLMNTGHKPVSSAAGLVTTVAYQFGRNPACFALEGSIAISGALVQWLRDNLGLIRDSGEIEALAASVQDNGDVYIVPAFSGLYAPHWKERCAGRDYRPDALRESRPYRSRGAGGDGLSNARCGRGDGAGLSHSIAGAACRWRHGRERSVDAVSIRHSGCQRGATESDRDDSSGRGVCRWPGDGLLEEHG